MTDSITHEHESVQLLLPWYLNETLDELESARVKRHLSGCLVCRSDLNQQRVLLQKMHYEDTNDLMIKNDFDQLRNRIQSDANVISLTAKQADRKASTQRKYNGWPMMAAASVMAFAVGLAMMPMDQTNLNGAPGAYKTLSVSPMGQSVQKTDDILVVFNESVSRDKIDHLALELNLKIVSIGENDRIVRMQSSDAEIAARHVVEQLRQRDIVMFAETALSGE